MNTSSNTPIIAFPGEKRNATILKQFLLEQGLIGDSDMNPDTFPIPSLGVKMIAMRSSDAVKFLTGGNIAGVMNGLDILSEELLSRRMKFRTEPGGNLDESIVGFDSLPPRQTVFPYMSSSEAVPELPSGVPLSLSGLFDTTRPIQLCSLIRSEDTDKLPDLEKISRRGDILTSYPYLVRSVLARRFGGGLVGRIKSVGGKVENLLANRFGASAVDIVDTGETAKKNGLMVGDTLFRSYPVLLLSDRDTSENPIVRNFGENMLQISNQAYYNDRRYEQKYPRG